MLEKVWLIPLFSLIFSFLAFALGYIIAVTEGHVHAVWPYISDTGTLLPESSIFGQLLNLSALFLALSIYLRHRQIVEFYWHKHHVEGYWRFFSLILLIIGYTSSLGVSIVANFQQHKSTMYVHYSGALLAFGGGLIYAWGQTIFSYIMSPKLVWKVVSHFRCLLTTIATLTFFTMILFGCILGKSKDKTTKQLDGYHLVHWTPDMPNFKEHTIGTCSEWILAICFQFYILSFAIELRGTILHAPKLDIEAMFKTSNEDTQSSYSKETDDSNLSKLPITLIHLPDNF
uniref:DNA damage-regulated autophagy modulator protein 2 n=1 Tax=Parastrongyloides trichosuri TaxID=131310 RepID=A0A0N4ZQ32_PARTI